MATSDAPLRFVTFLAPEMFGVYEEIVAWVGHELGTETTLTVGTHDYDVFARGDADFGFI
jgi:hypothetical protein